MKGQKKMNPRWSVITGCILLVLSVSAGAQGADENSYTLLIQTSPPDGGIVSPGTGVLAMPAGQKIPLTATPNRGYRFAYWLGDVSSNGPTDAVVSIDSPKLVVAVFVREEFEETLPGLSVIDGQVGGGGGGQRYVSSPVQSAGSVSPAYGSSGGGYTYNFPNIPDDDIPIPDNGGDDDIPVPGDGGDNDIPVPGDGEVPEPATIILLGLGTAALVVSRKR